ncbi:hypothetical protein G7Y89_g10312 [Cudoniella acicularis]|uniref:Uncharacterized protein n=1 Tax=Cudoniella acicularis TaxID=354080 RepID=A0A8H4VZC1_9HELO|nr:hypothetical protein G7Y89_g10312 [Cudoniella acicularis]
MSDSHSLYHEAPARRASETRHQRSGSNNERTRVEPGDLCVGCIVWLPPKDDGNDNIKCNCSTCTYPSELNDEGYNHPVIVLKISQKKGSFVAGDLVTTFTDTPLSSYIAQRTRRLQGSIPIFHPDSTPSTPEETHLSQLNLENGKLHKQSYIRLKHTYPIHCSLLRTFKPWQRYRAYKLRIDQESYGILMQHLRRKKEEWVETEDVRNMASRRLMGMVAGESKAVRAQNASVGRRERGGAASLSGAYPREMKSLTDGFHDFQTRSGSKPDEHNDEGKPGLLVSVLLGVLVAGVRWWKSVR